MTIVIIAICISKHLAASSPMQPSIGPSFVAGDLISTVEISLVMWYGLDGMTPLDDDGCTLL